jgi:hypothetical protein
MTEEFHLDIPDEVWEENPDFDNPSDRLAVTLYVNGVYPMHFEAWAVTYDQDRFIQHLPDWDDTELDDLHAAVHGDGSFRTITIRDREYILVAFPYC